MTLDPITAIHAITDYHVEACCLNGYKLDSVHIVNLDNYYKFRLSKYYPDMYGSIVDCALPISTIDLLDSTILQYIIHSILTTEGIPDLTRLEELVYDLIRGILLDITTEEVSIYSIIPYIIELYNFIRHDSKRLCIEDLKTMDGGMLVGKYYVIDEVYIDFTPSGVGMHMVVSHYEQDNNDRLN